MRDDLGREIEIEFVSNYRFLSPTLSISMVLVQSKHLLSELTEKNSSINFMELFKSPGYRRLQNKVL